MLLYRFEQENGDGFWYSKSGKFINAYGKHIKDIEMPYDNRKHGYKASCISKEQLFAWATAEEIKKMGGYLVVVSTNDYEIISDKEIVYNPKNSVLIERRKLA